MFYLLFLALLESFFHLILYLALKNFLKMGFILNLKVLKLIPFFYLSYSKLINSSIDLYNSSKIE